MFERIFGLTNEEAVPLIVQKQLPAEEIALWSSEKETTYRSILSQAFPSMDGANELIERLYTAGFALGVASSGPRENMDLVISALPCGDRISATVADGDVVRGKPDPAVFLRAAGLLGVWPCACAVVEDSVHGLLAARRAGMSAIGLVGTAPADVLREYAHVVVGSLRAVVVDGVRHLIDQNRRSSRWQQEPLTDT